jgi:hypothetical protein
MDGKSRPATFSVVERGPMIPRKASQNVVLESDKSMEWIRLSDQFFHYCAAQKWGFAWGEAGHPPRTKVQYHPKDQHGFKHLESPSYGTARAIQNIERSTFYHTYISLSVACPAKKENRAARMIFRRASASWKTQPFESIQFFRAP